MSQINIEIRSATEDTIHLNIYETYTAEFIKLEIKKQTEIPVKSQRLLYRGKELNNYQQIKECGIKDGEIIQLAVTKAIMYVYNLSFTYNMKYFHDKP